jgi:hypothetical protein
MTDDSFRDAVMKLFEITIEDIDRTKQWQWTVFYHTVIAQGGLLALYSSIPVGERTWVLAAFFVVLSFIVSFLGASVILDATKVLHRFRDRIGRCYDVLGEEFRRVAGERIKTTYHTRLFWACVGMSVVVVCLILLR